MSELKRILPDESLALKMKKKGIWLYVLSFIVLPCSYIIKVLVSRELSVSDVGIVYSVLGFIGIISIYNDLGLTDALQYYIPKYLVSNDEKKIRGLLRLTVILQFCSAIVISFFLFSFGPWLAVHHFDAPQIAPILKNFGRYFVFLNIFQVTQSLYFSLQYVKVEKGLELLRMLCVMAVVGLLWYFGYLSLVTFTYSWFIGLVVALLGTFVVLKNYGYSRFFLGEYTILRADVTSWLSYGFRSLIGANAWTIISQIDLQLIIGMIGNEAAGYWTNYLSLTSLLIFIFVPLLSFCFPVFTEYIEKKQFTIVKKARNILLLMIVGYAIFLGVAASFFGTDLAVLIFGNQYVPTGIMISMSAFLLCTPLLGIVNFQYIRSFGKVKEVSLVQVGVLLLHVLVSYLVLRKGYSFMYIGIVLHISHFIFYLVTEIYIRKKIHLV